MGRGSGIGCLASSVVTAQDRRQFHGRSTAPHAPQNLATLDFPPMSPPLLYRLAARTAVPLIPFIFREKRQREAHTARLGAAHRIMAWAATSRDRSRPLMWFHAPSVGEGLQAQAVIEAVRVIAPDVQVVYTHYSPSAEAFAKRVPADCADYLRILLTTCPTIAARMSRQCSMRC